MLLRDRDSVISRLYVQVKPIQVKRSTRASDTRGYSRVYNNASLTTRGDIRPGENLG